MRITRLRHAIPGLRSVCRKLHNSKMYASRAEIRHSLNEIKTSAINHHSLMKLDTMRSSMLQGWRLVLEYGHWLADKTSACTSKEEIMAWDGDGCQALMTELMAERVLQLRGKDKGNQRKREWRIRVPPLQRPKHPSDVFDTVDPFPSYYTVSNFLFEPIRAVLVGPSRKLQGSVSLMGHRVVRAFPNRVAAFIVIETGTTWSDSDLDSACGHFLLSLRSGTKYQPDAIVWMTSPDREKSVPWSIVRNFPKMLKRVETRLGVLAP